MYKLSLFKKVKIFLATYFMMFGLSISPLIILCFLLSFFDNFNDTNEKIFVSGSMTIAILNIFTSSFISYLCVKHYKKYGVIMIPFLYK